MLNTHEKSLEEKIAYYGQNAVFYTQLGQDLTEAVICQLRTIKHFFSASSNNTLEGSAK